MECRQLDPTWANTYSGKNIWPLFKWFVHWLLLINHILVINSFFTSRCNSWPYLSTHSNCCFENVIIHEDSCGGLDSMPSFSGFCLLIFTSILTLLDLERRGKMVETKHSLLVHKRKLLSMELIGNWMSCMKVQKQMVTQVLSWKKVRTGKKEKIFSRRGPNKYLCNLYHVSCHHLIIIVWLPFNHFVSKNQSSNF